MWGYLYKTRRGPVYIAPRSERWHIVHAEEYLGSYHSPMSADDDASGGHTFSP